MSDEGEKTCPLCAEEMDLTDQQLKPCKCGYEICVWCWNHIMEMAEKDETEGRCPACRTPYDKKKIVGTAAKCERLVAEINLEKKKSQKAKTRTAEGRKQLSSVRVIKRNLVYIVGLPLNLADEDLLLRKEYFGQYGKVSKVSLSRTSAGTIQQFPNNTCSVYITYSKEEEAVRCIQSIHGFILEDRPLRACFGTTKYCHAWLRNTPCTIPDCLYLHEIGSEEDSFTKDEIVSAHSRVQQVTGVAESVQRRSGSVLPPPADEYCNNSSATAGKPVLKSTSNNLLSSAKVSPATSSAGKGGALPPAASWGIRDRTSDCLSPARSLVCLNGPAKHKHDAAGGAQSAFSAAVSGTSQVSLKSNDLGKKASSNDDSYPKDHENKPKHLESVKQHGAELQTKLVKSSDVPAADVNCSSTVRQPPEPITLDNDRTMHPVREQSSIAGSDRDNRAFAKEEKSNELRSEVAITIIDKQMSTQNSMVARPNGLSLDCRLDDRDRGLEHGRHVTLQEELASRGTTVYGATTSTPDKQSLLTLSSGEREDFDVRRPSDVMATQTSLPSTILSSNLSSCIRSQSQCSDAASAHNHNINSIVNKRDEAATVSIPMVASNGLGDNDVHCTSGTYNSYVPPNGLHQKRTGKSDNEPISNDSSPGTDVIESSIISNILSLELDPWDDSLTPPQDLVNLLGENARRQGSSSRRAQNSGQSRFSFARHDEPPCQLLDVQPSYSIEGSNPHLFSPSVEKGEPYMNSMRNGFGVSYHSADQYDGFGSNQSVLSTNKPSASRSQISAPPGFSTPSRLPPPGFSSYGRNEQNLEQPSVFSSYGPYDRKFEHPPGFSSYDRSDQSFEQMPVHSSYGPNDQKFKQPPGFSSYGRSDQSFEQHPGFSSYRRSNLTFDMNSGNHFLETSINSYHPPGSTSSTSVSDIEFIDPAILAVGKGRSPTGFNSNIDLNSAFPTQTSALESNSQLHLLMQRPHSPRQSLRYTDIRDNYSRNDAYELCSGHKEPTQIGSLSPFSQFALQAKSGIPNGQWDAWPEAMTGSSMGMAELLQNDRLGFNKLYTGYEPSKFHMPTSGDLYNRTFGM